MDNNKPFKVILINPFYSRIILKNGMSFHYHKTFQPLCLAYTAALCKQENIEVEIIDANVEKISSSDPYWKTLKADLFCVTTASIDNWQCPFLELDDVKSIIESLNTKNNILTFGPLVTEKPAHTLEILGKRVIGVRGEPEFTLLSLITHIRNGTPWENIPGISYFNEKSQVIQDNENAPSFDINKLPQPAYSLLPMNKYKYEIMGKDFCVMETSRGCPYQCNFCLTSMYREVYKNRDPKKVVEDIKYLQQNFGVKNIFFIDLEFTIRKKETIALCQEICNQNIHIDYAIQARVDKVDDEVLHWLRKSGCKLIHFGVESGNPEILQSTNKMVTLEQIQAAFSRTKKAGIKRLAYFTFGHPTETKEDILQTIAFAKKLNPDYASFVIIIPYPGLPIYNETNPSVFYVGANKNLTVKELETLRKKALRDFYMQPKYILSRLASIKSINDIKVLWMGFNELFIPLVNLKAFRLKNTP